MRFTDLDIQTLRDAPNNAHTPGFAFLVRAGYLTREDEPTALGEHTLAHLELLHRRLGEGFLDALAIPHLRSHDETFHAVKQAFDEHTLLNPGKAVPTLRRCVEFGHMHVHAGQDKFPDLPRF